MPKIPRKYIPLMVKLASVLADRLPVSQRRALMEQRASPQTVLRLFEFDHLALHAMGKNDPLTDAWWNLDAKLVPKHQAKFATDMAILTKAKRIKEQCEIDTAKAIADARRMLLAPNESARGGSPGKRYYRPIPGSIGSPWKKPIRGPAVRREPRVT